MEKKIILYLFFLWKVDLTPSMPHWKTYVTALFLLKGFSVNCRRIKN